MLKRVTIAAVSALAASVLLATPSSAEPGNPCELAINFLCRFVPIAPNLEGDVDLSGDQSPADPNAPAPESLPPVDPCAAGCI